MARVTDDGSPAQRRRAGNRLALQVLAAAVAGVGVGLFWPGFGAALAPLAELFVRLLNLVVAPVVFVTLAAGLASAPDRRAVGRLGAVGLVYFEVMSALALAFGLLAALLLRPGAGLDAAPSAEVAAQIAGAGGEIGLSAFLLGIIPSTFLGAFASGNMLQVLFVSLLTGFALAGLGATGAPVVRALEIGQRWVFALVEMILKAAPVGAFGAMAFVVGRYGVGVLEGLAWLAVTVYAAQAAFVLLVLGAVARLSGFRLLALLALLKEELVVVAGTSCSEAALPGTIRKLEAAGLDHRTAGLIVPMGYAFNLDGTNIYMTVALLFMAQATGTVLSVGDMAALLGVAMLTTRGMPGIPGAVFVALAATLSIVPAIPVGAIALLLAVDRFLNAGRAVTNVIGNAVGALAAARLAGAGGTIQLPPAAPVPNRAEPS